MNYTSIDLYFVIDTFLLLLIGVGPKIALVPFVEITAALDTKTKALVVRKMLTTAGVVSLLLVGLGELLARLLHFSTGSLSIAGGLILVIIAITMVLGAGEPKESQAIKGRDPLRVATFPLAVPYLLNPAGIVTLVTLSAEADSVGVFAMVVVLLGVVLASGRGRVPLGQPSQRPSRREPHARHRKSLRHPPGRPGRPTHPGRTPQRRRHPPDPALSRRRESRTSVVPGCSIMAAGVTLVCAGGGSDTRCFSVGRPRP